MFKISKRGLIGRRTLIHRMATAAALVVVSSGCAGGRLQFSSSNTNDRDDTAQNSESQGVVVKAENSKGEVSKDANSKSARSKATTAKSGGAVPKTAPMSPAMVDYRQTLARHIRSASADQAFEGVPPNPLYAIVVLSWQIDAEGKVSNLRVLRSAAHAPATDKLALESVHRAQTLPKPSAAVLRQGGGGKRLTVLESWLFKDAKHFQLRTLAQNQASE